MTRGATLLFLWAALVVALFPATNAQLMGIDTGSMFFKVALVKPGSPFQIVTNVHSKRKTETLLAFEDGERRFGGDANTLASRRPKQAIAFAPRLLGRSVKHPAIAELANQYLPFQVSEDDTGRGAANLTVVGGGASDAPDVSLSPEEAMAMVLTHAKSNAERFNGGVVTDAVLTVPSYFTVKEREAMRDAAHIAGLRVLSLIEENTAAALQYGISRIFNETHTMLVFNMGASSTQVSVFEYTSYTLKKGSKNQTFGQFKTIGKGWDESLGGFAFDLKLVEFMADAFDASKQRKGKKPVRKNDRSMAKLRKTAGKVKQVLSANKKYPITIESLCDDMDFRGTLITRDEFEEMSSDLFDRVLGPVERALEMANKTAEDIDQIEIVGGGVRIPKVQALLVEMFKLKSASDLGVHLNGDEAMALGAAFRAANMSKAFRVGRVERSVGMVETANYPIGLRLEEIAAEEAEEKEEDSKDDEAPPKDGESDAETKKKKKKWSKRVSLFSRKSDLLKKKKIKLTHDHDFQVILKYDSHSKAPLDDSTSKVFHEFNVTGLRKFATGEYKHLGTPAVELVFQINDDGIPVVTKAEAKLEEIITPEVKDEEKAEEPSKDSDGAESEEKAGSEESSKAEEKTDESSTDKAEEKSTDDTTAKEGEADEDAGKDDKAETSDGDKKEQDENGSDKTADDKSKEETKQKKAPKPRKRVHRVQLKLVPTVSEAQTLRRLSQKERNTAIKRLKEMDAADELRQRRDAEKNSLESFVFEQRGRVRENEEELSKVSPVSYT